MPTLFIVLAIFAGCCACLVGWNAQTADRAMWAFVLGVVTILLFALAIVSAFVGMPS
ncbi:hypothetical protein [Zhengella mangrovi]|uniref:hypothetical protein n=1 Tax=Zhengella mangrovi TaxID=1982044 RepID=UPI0013FDC292|nr:hypothetical protein [Zhengella mangrovi]